VAARRLKNLEAPNHLQFIIIYMVFGIYFLEAEEALTNESTYDVTK
jgi:hypothetical protein